jgi:DNA gyrase subunit B
MEVQRYKGLGEMNPQQLWDTTMDPEKRIMMQVEIEDMVSAHEIVQTLMGEEVPPRKAFILAHALQVKNLDV